MRFVGENAKALFAPEGGGHRWQRVPPTERRGRVQTSSITVAVMDDNGDSIEAIQESDVRIETYIGQGPGGQHRNKTATAIRATHVPTGTVATCEDCRSQRQNKMSALRVLASRVREAVAAQRKAEGNRQRREQIGTGYRGDKIRTIQMQNDRVTNHATGKKMSAARYMKGYVDEIQ